MTPVCHCVSRLLVIHCPRASASKCAIRAASRATHISRPPPPHIHVPHRTRGRGRPGRAALALSAAGLRTCRWPSRSRLVPCTWTSGRVNGRMHTMSGRHMRPPPHTRRRRHARALTTLQAPPRAPPSSLRNDIRTRTSQSHLPLPQPPPAPPPAPPPKAPPPKALPPKALPPQRVPPLLVRPALKPPPPS